MAENTIMLTKSGNQIENAFPTETINLPTKGFFYPNDNPLSSGQVEIKMMTAKEEDILTSQNLIQKKIVFDKLLESLIINKNIKLDDIFICDRTAILFAVRRLAYGDEYKAQVTCGRCTKESEIVIDLGKMDNKPFNFESYVKGNNSFMFVLPYSKKTIEFKLLNKKDEATIDQEIALYAKVSKELSKEITTRLSTIILSVDGNSNKIDVRKFVENMPSKDSLAFRNYYKDNLPELDTSFMFNCPHCGLERKENTPMGVSFFWPNQ